MTKKPSLSLWLNCRKCSHTWAAIDHPMELRMALRFLRALKCPECSAGPDHIYHATENQIMWGECPEAAADQNDLTMSR